jgi:hypothetical protein
MNEAPTGGETPSTATYLAAAALVRFEHEGGWAGPLRAHAPIEALDALIRLPGIGPEALESLAQALMERLESDGRMALYPGGPADAGACVLTYAALKLAGVPRAPNRWSACARIRSPAGACRRPTPTPACCWRCSNSIPANICRTCRRRREWPRFPAWARAQLAPLSHSACPSHCRGEPARRPARFHPRGTGARRQAVFRPRRHWRSGVVWPPRRVAFRLPAPAHAPPRRLLYPPPRRENWRPRPALPWLVWPRTNPFPTPVSPRSRRCAIPPWCCWPTRRPRRAHGNGSRASVCRAAGGRGSSPPNCIHTPRKPHWLCRRWGR